MFDHNIKKRPKILIIGATKGGGVGTVNTVVAELLKDSGLFEIELLDKNKINKKNKYFKYIKYYLFCFKYVIKFKPDYVYLQVSESAYLFQSIILLFSKIINKKITTIAHLHCKPEPKKLKIYFARFSQLFIDKIIVINKAAFSYFKNNIKWKKKIIYLPNFLKSNSIVKYRKSLSSRKYILYIGRMHEEKGIYEILEIAKHYNNEKFIFIGDFSDKIQEKKFIKLANELPNVKWLGPIYNEDKFEKISYSKLLLFPTHWRGEIFPLTIIECGLLGVPSFVTPVGAINEIITDKENGVFIKSYNYKENIKILSDYLSDNNKLKKLSINCMKDFSEKYTSEKNKTKLINFIFE
ncbi:MAG: glycosyltransferase family 4 protein [Candidatus Helarchaeota archaeon]